MKKLHIGCLGEKIPGFTRVDIVQWGDVDIVTDAKDLRMIPDGAAEEIYASHILEHFKKTETDTVLKEWCRVLKKGGILWCAVPDFDKIVDIYLRNNRSFSTWLGHILNGDQKEDIAFHYNNFTYATLSGCISMAGFSRIDKVDVFPYDLIDASKITDSLFRIPISLNVKATK
jgi:predicted SAM-dependent methyltransferase